MGDIWQAARANNVKRVKALLDEGTSPDATRWVRFGLVICTGTLHSIHSRRFELETFSMAVLNRMSTSPATCTSGGHSHGSSE